MTAGVLSAALVGGYGAVVGGSISVTNRGSAVGEDNTAARSLSAFTPANGSLLVATYQGLTYTTTGDPHTNSSVSGGSLTWTRRVAIKQQDGFWTGWTTIWTAPVVTGVSTTVSGANTVDSQWSSHLTCFELSGQHASPIGGNWSTSVEDADQTNVSVTLSSGPAANSWVIAAVEVDNESDSQPIITPNSNWTEVYSFDRENSMNTSIVTRVGAAGIAWDALNCPDAVLGGNVTAAALEILAA